MVGTYSTARSCEYTTTSVGSLVSMDTLLNVPVATDCVSDTMLAATLAPLIAIRSVSVNAAIFPVIITTLVLVKTLVLSNTTVPLAVDVVPGL